MQLAKYGGFPVRTKPWGKHPVISGDEIIAVQRPFNDNCFSGFRAGWPDGGLQVQLFESKIQKLMGSKYSLAFDTWSNGIIAVLMALGVEYGDEVILPAYTMSACATSILACGAIPVFADIDETNCCLDPKDIARKISPKTKVIMVVHLFGMPADMDKILELAGDKIFVFEDTAQAPLATYKGRICGTIGDVGGYSFTESKHVMSGEGGIAVTNDVKIANGLRYVRNHGEVTTLYGCHQDYANNMYAANLIGFNFRLTELAAALGQSQVDWLQEEVAIRRSFAGWLDSELKDVPFLYFPKVDYEFEHSYYCYTLRFRDARLSRDLFCECLKAEGMPFQPGYCQPIYNQNIYHTHKHWVIRELASHIDYSPLPITERMDKEELLVSVDIRSPNTMADMHDIRDGILKVSEYFASESKCDNQEIQKNSKQIQVS